MTKQVMDWEKILAKPVSDKGLILRICKQLSNLNFRKKKKEGWGKTVCRTTIITCHKLGVTCN